MNTPPVGVNEAIIILKSTPVAVPETDCWTLSEWETVSSGSSEMAARLQRRFYMGHQLLLRPMSWQLAEGMQLRVLWQSDDGGTSGFCLIVSQLSKS